MTTHPNYPEAYLLGTIDGVSLWYDRELRYSFISTDTNGHITLVDEDGDVYACGGIPIPDSFLPLAKAHHNLMS